MGANGKKTLVVRHGTLIDGNGGPPSQNDAIVVEGNRIRSVGALPGDLHLEDRDNVEVIDASGKWVMPGLMDGHCHLSFGNPPMPAVKVAAGATSPEFSTLRAAINAQRVLKSGVTSISSPGGTWFIDVAIREAIDAGFIEGPRVSCAGHFIVAWAGITDNAPHWMGNPEHHIAKVCNSTEAMLTEVRRELKHGVDFIKIGDSPWGDFQAMSKEEMTAVVEEAHRRNAPVTIHSRGADSTRDAADAGVDWIIHADLATDRDLEAVAQAGVPIMPSLTFMYNALEMGRDYGMPEYVLDSVKYNIDHSGSVLEKCRKLGITMMCGTDAGNTPLNDYEFYHADEPEILVKQGGYTPMEAIVAFTKNTALTIGLDGELGTLEAGKLADLLILDADPVADITVLKGGRMISTIVKDGHVVDCSALAVDGHQLELAPLK